jgi:NADH-quinone oxidoreductase subunit E
MSREIVTILERHGASAGLIPVLSEIQDRFHYLPQDGLILVSKRLGIALSEIYSVATFYHAFSLIPRGRHILQVCTGTACHVRGAMLVLGHLENKLDIAPGETTRDREITLETVNCLGCCALGPVAVLDGEYQGQVTTRKIDRLLKRSLSVAGGADG